MTAPAGPGAPITVHGGANGIEARADDLTELAKLYGRAATDTGGTALTLHGYLSEGFGLSSMLDPVGAVEFEATLGLALDGPGGVTMLAAHCAELDLRLRAAAAAYTAADRLDRAVGPLDAALSKLPGAVVSGVGTLQRTDSPWEAFQAFATHDPELADVVVRAAGGPDGRALKAFSGLLADGHAAVSGLGDDPAIDSAGPPRCLADVVAGLSNRNAGEAGEIDVRRLTGADGSTSYIVDIPGTNAWTIKPSSDATSLTTDLLAIAGRPTSYERGVLTAMAAAGIRPTDRVMLVGHSEGGMIAVNIAARMARSARFNITNVVTAGSPIGATASRVPDKVQVLALENISDAVPHTDGRDNPAAPNVTTVTVRHPSTSFENSHGLEPAYVPGARDVDRSANPSVVAYRNSAAAFLNATGVTTTRFLVSRGY